MAEAAIAEQTETTPAPSPEEVVATPEGDAAASTPADAGSTQETPAETPDYEAEYEAWASEQTQKEGGEKQPEPAQVQGVDPAEVDNALRTFRANHDTRQKALDALHEDLVEAGMPDSVAKRFVKEAKDKLNEHHADSLNLAGYEAATREAQSVVAGLQQAVPKPVYESLVAKAQKGGLDYKVIFADVFAAGKAEGDKQGKEAGRKEGFIAGRSHAERVANGASSGQQIEGTAAVTRFTNEDALDTAFANKEISREQYAAEKKRLTGRDL